MPEDEDESDRVQASVWVSSDKRDDWDDYADELGFESRGAMIRNAVRFFYQHKTQDESRRVLQSLKKIDGNTQSIEAKTDSIKIDQLEGEDIDLIANEVESRVIGGLVDILGNVDSIAEIESRSSDEQ